MKSNNKTKYAILGVLNLEPGSGYDIKKFCDFSISHFWNENYAHIYPVLKELEKEGLVSGTQEKSGGRPAKNIYSITEAGREKLFEWLEKPVEHGPERNELLLKLFFSGDAPKQKTIDILEDQKRRLNAELSQYIEIEKFLNSQESLKGNKGLPFWLATVNFGKISAASSIQWCEETMKAIEGLAE